MQLSNGFLVVGVVSIVVYANTLIGDFTFDDNFAVVRAIDSETVQQLPAFAKQ